MSERGDYAFQRLIADGWSPQAASAAVGAFQQESGEDLDTTAVHDQGTGYGIAGWRDEEEGAGRKTSLMQFAQENGLNPDDLDTQLDFFNWEVNNSEGEVGEMLRNAQSPDEAVEAMLHYERPQGYTPDNPTAAHGFENRYNNAVALFSNYTGETVEPLFAPEETTTAQAIPTDDEDPSVVDKVADAVDSYVDPVRERVDDAADQVSETIDDWIPGDFEVGGALEGAAQASAPRQKREFDYTPAGDPVQPVGYDPNEGAIPVNAYRQYVAMDRGGNVEHQDVDSYFNWLNGG